ncbi:E3 ubiquitin-protein ligase SINA-like 2 [Striga hermonthica]|uniref:E3 ubiquitin-protein ligase SINA-like 2 n=1 Tax=Striga hermonthica TaxID=68872 RepID=A0A9N7RNR9_STRHE|nr:E3 ubiquitin-protein ligase SINA-like 2 [Striga hermonthica]
MARKTSKKPRSSSANTRASPQPTYVASPQPAEASGGFGSLDDDDEEMVNPTTPSAMDGENCENGHVSCGPCCVKMHNNCGSCSCPIGSSRCRAIERVLDSVRVTCPNALHGCTESLAYNEKLNHERTCHHSPCSCPHPDCSYTSLPASVYSHFATIHPTSSQFFSLGSKIHVSLGTEQGHVFLQYVLDDTLFVLSRKSLSIGSALKALAETRAVWLRGQLPGNKILFVPKDFVGADGKLELEVTITMVKNYELDFNELDSDSY